MLADLYSFITSADTGALDQERAAAISVIRAAIANSGVSPASMRMFPDILDEGVTLPALTYQLIDNGADHTLDGAADGLYHPRVQVDVWAMSAVARASLGEAVKTALDGYTGAFMAETFVGVLIWDNEIDSYEGDSDRKQYRKTLDFRIVHN